MPDKRSQSCRRRSAGLASTDLADVIRDLSDESGFPLPSRIVVRRGEVTAAELLGEVTVTTLPGWPIPGCKTSVTHVTGSNVYRIRRYWSVSRSQGQSRHGDESTSTKRPGGPRPASVRAEQVRGAAAPYANRRDARRAPSQAIAGDCS